MPYDFTSEECLLLSEKLGSVEGDGFLQGQWLPQGKGGFQISWEEGSSVDLPQMLGKTSDRDFTQWRAYLPFMTVCSRLESSKRATTVVDVASIFSGIEAWLRRKY